MTKIITTLRDEKNIVQALVTHNGKYYVVSHATTIPETLIFESDKDGNITDWAEVGGTRSEDIRTVINNMDEYLY